MKFLALAVAAMLMASPANAQTADRLAALAAARDMLISVGFERQMEQTGMAMANTVMDHNIAQLEERWGSAIPADFKQRIRGVINAELAAMMTDLKKTALDDAAQIYADHFSAPELRRLTELNTDPVMRKAQSLLPTMMPQLARIGLKAASEHEPAMQAKIKEAVDEWTAAQKNKGSSS